jgi:hypothetical protein
MFFKEKWSPRTFDEFNEIPYIIKLKIEEYSEAQARGQEARSKNQSKS